MLLRVLLAVSVLQFGAQAYAQASRVLTLDPGEVTEQGLRYLHGEGLVSDPDLAIVHFCVAARHGHAAAAYELGWLYFHGRGGLRNDGLAAAWLHEASRLGKAPAKKVMQLLAGVAAGPLSCVDSRGRSLRAANGRHASLILAVYRMAPEFDLDPALVVEVIRAESDFNPRARSPKGALGLMQLIPATARRFGVTDPYQPAQNLRGGMTYLRWLLDRFDGDLTLSLAGYNAGEAAVERYRGVPPYAETQAYVKRILGRYRGGSGDLTERVADSTWRALPAG